MVKINVFSILFVVSTVNIFSSKNCCCKNGCCCKKCGKEGSKTSKVDERKKKFSLQDMNSFQSGISYLQKNSGITFEDDKRVDDVNKLFNFNTNNQLTKIFDNFSGNSGNIDLNPGVKPKHIKESFPYPPLMGLQNVGATCYMNATLQCFCQIEKFVDYFKMSDTVNKVIDKYKNENKPCLTEAFKKLIENLWLTDKEYYDSKNNTKNSNNNYFAPYDFKERISEMNELFNGAKANDSKDLVNFIIMTLHEELNKTGVRNDPNNFKIVDQTNDLSVLDNFIDAFKRDNRSMISDNFYGVSTTVTQCSFCHTSKYNYQIYFFLIFPLDEVRKYTQHILQQLFFTNPAIVCSPFYQSYQNMLNSNIVNIYDCFEYNQKIDYFKGENSMYCNICHQTKPASYVTQLFTSPEILIIVLNRGKGIEFKTKLLFDENLNIRKYVLNTNDSANYKLIGVVTHYGESGASGHFVANCKSPIDGQWYNYNDDLVTKINNFESQVINHGMPYILLYQKVH